MTSIQKASAQRRWLTKPVTLMAGEPGSGVLAASVGAKSTHLAWTVRRTYRRNQVRMVRSSNAAGNSKRLLRSMSGKGAPLRFEDVSGQSDQPETHGVGRLQRLTAVTHVMRGSELWQEKIPQNSAARCRP